MPPRPENPLPRPRGVTGGGVVNFVGAFLSLVALWFSFDRAQGAEAKARPYVLKAGQELTFAITVANGVATPGPAALGRLGGAEAKDGELVVGLTPRDKDLYSQVMVTEKTSVPVDFVATGHIGEIVIDERVICGRLGAPFAQRIGGVSWTVELHDFTVGKPCE